MDRFTWQRALGSCLLAVAAGASQAATSGLIPSAGPVGATLYSDATTLWPLKAGSTTEFYGLQQGLGHSVYKNTLTIKASGSGFVESYTNLVGAGAEQSGVISVVGGHIVERESVQWVPGGITSTYQTYHLKSPVRAGDRYVGLDSRITDVGADLDGDGKNDSLDVASWTQVRNMEVIDLPLRSGIRALRVETFGKVRARYSSGGVSAVVSLTQTRWYAPGLGLIKMQLDEPGDVGTTRKITDEIATNVDLVDSGLGLTKETPLVVPSGYAGAGNRYRRGTYSAFAAGTDFAVLLTASTTTRLSKLNARGQVVAIHDYDLKATTGRSAWPVEYQRLVMTPYGLRLVYRNSTDGYLYLLKFSTDGQAQQDTTPVRLTTSGLRFEALYSNSRLWIISTQSGQLTVQAYTVAGVPSYESAVLSEGVQYPDELRVDAGASKLVLTWKDTFVDANFESYDGHSVATFSTVNGALLGRDLLAPVSTYAPCNDPGTFSVRPLIHGTAIRVLCYGADSFFGGARQSELTDAYLAPRTGSGRVSTSAFLPDPSDASRLQRAGASLLHSDFATVKLSPLHSQATNVMQFRSHSLASSSLSASGFKVLARHVPATGDIAQPLAIIPLSDRLLVVVSSSLDTINTPMKTVVVWR